ncbi:hypothetical protein [Undibacterium squillarum]|uniref:Secreted protein n=1 Tax=Undibacterium squillarum TaxID=1131567 RepID=A0ABQ2Y306_9BURK|nr:hypothetical protein [Undibacterium squillarum]GGX53185.1 hypothetical protein GCM10010946_34720 [Undibacterium squillarum]
MKTEFSAVKTSITFAMLLAAYSWAAGEQFDAEAKAAEATSNAIYIEQMDAADRRRERQAEIVLAAADAEQATLQTSAK